MLFSAGPQPGCISLGNGCPRMRIRFPQKEDSRLCALLKGGNAMLGGILIAIGILLCSTAAEGAVLLGILLMAIGGAVFWNNSATKQYLDDHRDE